MVAVVHMWICTLQHYLRFEMNQSSVCSTRSAAYPLQDCMNSDPRNLHDIACCALSIFNADIVSPSLSFLSLLHSDLTSCYDIGNIDGHQQYIIKLPSQIVESLWSDMSREDSSLSCMVDKCTCCHVILPTLTVICTASALTCLHASCHRHPVIASISMK